MSEPLRNYEQAAEWLGVPKRWLEDQVRAGNAPHAKLGKHVRFTQQHLDAIVRAGESVEHAATGRERPTEDRPVPMRSRPKGGRPRKSPS